MPIIVKKNHQWLDKYKVFFTTSYSADAINPPAPILAGCNEICTETFLVLGPFENEVEMQNLGKYMQTDIFKVALFFGRGSMQVSKDVFRFVPLPDFSENSDITWTRSLADINHQLYDKYGLKQPEIDFIEKMIKPMED